jgi:FAD/FMN-containing dehydrogenase
MSRHSIGRTRRRLITLRIKGRVVDLMHEHGGVHFQIGKVYPYARDHDPAHWALLKAMKAQLDPKGILNPGNLGL